MKTLTAHEVARLLRVRVETVYRYAREGSIPVARVGGRWRFDEARLRAWLDNGAARPAAAPRTARPRLDWRKDPLLKVIGIGSDGHLAENIDKALYDEDT